MEKVGNMKKVLVIHGPNLNLLGRREPDLYGDESLDTLNGKITSEGVKLGMAVEVFQSNSEGAIVDKIQAGALENSMLIINPAAYTHTSVAIRDAILAVKIPAIEVHLSNIYKREDFRKRSLISDIAVGQISGFGPGGYLLALKAASDYLGQ